MPKASAPYAPPATVETDSSAATHKIDYHGLKGTETGLRLYYWGIALFLLSFIATILAIFIFPPAVFFGGLGMLLSGILMLVGPFFCLTAPQATRARGLIIGSIGLLILGFITTIIENLSSLIPTGVGGLLSTVSSVLFLLFLIRIANHLQRPDLSSKGRTVLIGAIIVWALGFGVLVASALVRPDIAAMMIAVAVGALILFVMYANLIHSIYKDIAAGRASL